MSGFHQTFESNTPDLSLATVADSVSMHPTPSGNVALIFLEVTDGVHDNWIVLADYTDPVNVIFGTPYNLGSFPLGGSEAICTVLPTSDKAIITRSRSFGLLRPLQYAVVDFDTVTLTVTSVTAWADLAPPAGYTDPNAQLLAPLPTFSDTALVLSTNYQVTFGTDVPVFVPLTFNLGTNVLTAGTAVDASDVPLGAQFRESWIPGPGGTLLVLATATGSGYVLEVASSGAHSIVVDGLVDGSRTPMALWQVDSTTGRAVISDQSGLLGNVGQVDIDLTTGTASSLHVYSDPWAGDVEFACQSGDGTLAFLGGPQPHPAGGILLGADLHPRGDPGTSCYTRPLPISGPHVLGLVWFGGGSPTTLNVGRISEVPDDRFAEADPAYPGYVDEVIVGSPVSADLSYDHFGYAGHPRPVSGPYWRPIVSWRLDWGDGTIVTGPGPISAEPYPAFPDVAFTLSHTYASPGIYTATFSVIDGLGLHSTPNFPATFFIDPRTTPLYLRSFPRSDGLGAGSGRSFPPPDTAQHGPRSLPTTVF